VTTRSVRARSRELYGVADRERVLHLTTLTESALAACAAGRHERAHALAARGARVVDRIAPAERGRIAHLLAPLMAEWAGIMDGCFDFAHRRTLLDHAYSWALAAGDLGTAARVAGRLACDNAFTGRRAAARDWADRAEALWSASGRHGAPAALRIAEAMLRAAILDFDEALQLLDDSEACGDLSEDDRFLTAALRALWGAHTRPEDLDRLRDEVEALSRVEAASPLRRLLLSVVLARLHLFAGHPERALPLLNDARGMRACGPLLLVHRAMAHLALGDYAAADVDASAAPENVSCWPRCDAEMQVVRAAARLGLDDAESAIACFRCAVALVGAHDLPYALTAVAAPDIERLAQLTFGTDSPAHVVSAARAAALAPSRGSVRLTAREERLMRTLIEYPGLSVQEVAHVLGVSRNTVKSQLSGLFRKTGVRTRVQLVRLAKARLAE
jgi:DNA-binding CsgD family transcriptional regulator